MLTWALDFFLSSIPAWMWLAGAVAGLAVYFLSGILSHFTPIKTYTMFLKPIGGVAALLCVFMYGGSGVQSMWEEKVRVAQEEADRKAQESKEFSEKLDAERKKKQKVRVEYYNTIKTEIQVQKEFIDKDCKIDPKVPELINKAAKNPVGESK